MRTVASVISDLAWQPLPVLPRPAYTGTGDGARVCLAVESMRRTITDEGWQLTAGLEHAGYSLYGFNLPRNDTNVASIIEREQPGVVIVQDQREWDSSSGNKTADQAAWFRNIDALSGRSDIFTVTVLKDAQNRPDWHSRSASSMGCHAWIVYYHPDIVCHVARFVRREHCVRTWHSVDPAIVPEFSASGRQGCLLSGAVSWAYPWRKFLVQNSHLIPGMIILKHPGYHRRHCDTPDYLRMLSRFKVAICTSSRYGYALRKIIEATACGCAVITDLPVDDPVPEIDGNLTRLSQADGIQALRDAVRELTEHYDQDRQAYYANLTCRRFDYRETGRILNESIEAMRSDWSEN